MTTQGFRVREITKQFSGTPVLTGVSFDLSPGEIVGLVGHNGAGKSTLLKILSGAYRPDGGSLTLDEMTVTFASPSDALNNGVATVYQELSLLPNLTVTENVFLGREQTRNGMLSRTEMRKSTQELLDEFNLTISPDAKLAELPVATRQLLEIAIATTKETRYLLLDEPTTALEGEQVDYLLSYIKKLAQSRHIGIVIVDHKLDELYQICDRIIALVDGRVLLDADAKTVPHDEVVRAIVGHDVVCADDTESAIPNDVIAGEVMLNVRNLSGAALTNINLEAHAGLVLGVYGLVGSGRTEFLRTLIGIEPMTAGTIELAGKHYLPKNPAYAMKQGLAYLTEERKLDGIVPLMPSRDNMSLPILKRLSSAGWLKRAAIRGRTDSLLEELQVRGNTDGPIQSLSGGNQQKVLLGRVLAQEPKVLLLDEPTKGVDIGVKAEIHALLKQMAHDEGRCLIVVSSEEEEILQVSDSVAVFSQGQLIAGPLAAATLTVPKLRELAWSKS